MVKKNNSDMSPKLRIKKLTSAILNLEPTNMNPKIIACWKSQLVELYLEQVKEKARARARKLNLG